MRYFLGIDGGGTKTTALLCDENGRTAAAYTGGSINYLSVGLQTARNNLSMLVGEILSQRPENISAAFIGCAALSGPATEDEKRRLCCGVIPCSLIGMDSDVYIGLTAMETRPAALVICGTGSMAAGALADGKVLHTGGWGHLLGDEGSGYALGLDAVRAAIRGAEGSSAPTLLTKSVLRSFGLKNVNGLIPLFYPAPPARSDVAALAPRVFEAAAAGDAAAEEIIERHVKELSATACALLRQMPAGTPMGLWGGVFEHQPAYCERFRSKVQAEFSKTQVFLLQEPPVYGAVRAAMDLYEKRPKPTGGAATC